LEKVLEINSNHNVAKSLLSKVQEQIYARQRAQKVEQALRHAKEALGSEQFEEAVPLADKALGEFPDHPDVLKLPTQATRLAEAQRKRRYVDEQIQTARGFLQENQFSSAIALLQQALQVVPGDSRLMSCLKTVREAEERARLESLRQEAIRQGNEQIRAKDFAGTVTTLEKALARAAALIPG
jgi:tetratricopeptide (TPR) repeat protein